MLGVRVEDTVYHFPLVPKHGGDKLQLVLGAWAPEQPEFEWLADLVHHYTSPSSSVPFKLKDDQSGCYPSLASPTRMLLDQLTDTLMISDVHYNPRDDTLDAIFDAVVEEMFEISTFVLSKELAGQPYAKAKVPWSDGVLDGLPDDCTQLILEMELHEEEITAGDAEDALLEHMVDLAMRPLLQRSIEEILDCDEFCASSRSDALALLGFDTQPKDNERQHRYSSTQAGAFSGDNRFWSVDFRELFTWYIPEMNRPEVTQALTPMAVGDFIVYETPDGTNLPAEDPVQYIFDDAPPPYLPYDEAEEVDIEFSSEEEIEEAPEIEEPAPMVPTWKEAAQKAVPVKTKVLPAARRVKKAARVVRRGTKLGQFTDDAHLDVEVDPHTRIALAPKRESLANPAGQRSFGSAMFPQLRTASTIDGAAARPVPTGSSYLFVDAQHILEATEAAKPERLRTNTLDILGYSQDEGESSRRDRCHPVEPSYALL